MTRRIMLCRKNAQLGNRLMVYAHLLAACWERGWEPVNPTFEEYADGFTGTLPRPHGRSYPRVRLAWELGKIAGPLSFGRIVRARARNHRHMDLQQVVEAAEAGGARTLLLQGYHFRCPAWAANQAPRLREFFRPIDAHRLPAEAAVAALRARAPIVVGMHIRHGDYATHMDGRFFYSIERYLGFMVRMRELLAPSPVAFLVCSNVDIPKAQLDEFTWAPGPGAVVADLHALSLCGYVLGPPSSFSSWSAFAGGTRLLRIEDAERPFTLADFARQDAPETHH